MCVCVCAFFPSTSKNCQVLNFCLSSKQTEEKKGKGKGKEKEQKIENLFPFRVLSKIISKYGTKKKR